MFELEKAWGPEDFGIHSENIMNFLEDVKKIQYKLWTFLIIRHGKIAIEGAQYPFDIKHKHLVYSASKTITSTGIGVAVKEGLLDIHTPIIHYFPECNDLNMDPRARKITIENLLTMATGHGADSVGDLFNSNDAWPKAFFMKKIVHEPGKKFVYDSGGTYMLSEIIQRVTGKNLFEWTKEKVFTPLGIKDVFWDNHDGVTTGAWGVLISPRDLAKIGLLYLNKGKYNDLQILTEDWVKTATSLQINTGAHACAGWSQGYGYQIWRNNDNSYCADGAFGQYCMVFPEEDMVIVTTAEESDGSRIFPCIEKNLSQTPYPRDSYEELH